MSTSQDTLSEIVNATAILRDAGCPNPREDAETIFANVLDVDPSRLINCPSLNRDVADLIGDHIRRRSRREPLEYIVGRCDIFGLLLRVDPRVLVPQPVSEPLVTVARDLPAGARVHDVGTGSGAIALAIKHKRPDLCVTASDLSPAAIEVARANAARLHLDVPFTVARGLPHGDYDLVVANLPQVDEVGSIPVGPEFRDYQPHIAVFGGSDGLAIIRELLTQSSPAVTVAVEHQPSQAQAVRALFRDPTTLSDFSGADRVTFGHPIG